LAVSSAPDFDRRGGTAASARRLPDFATLTGLDVLDTTDLATTAIAFAVETDRLNDAMSRQ